MKQTGNQSIAPHGSTRRDRIDLRSPPCCRSQQTSHLRRPDGLNLCDGLPNASKDTVSMRNTTTIDAMDKRMEMNYSKTTPAMVEWRARREHTHIRYNSTHTHRSRTHACTHTIHSTYAAHVHMQEHEHATHTHAYSAFSGRAGGT